MRIVTSHIGSNVLDAATYRAAMRVILDVAKADMDPVEPQPGKTMVIALTLGLLLGSVAGLWPFQEALHPDLVAKQDVRAIAMLVAGDTDDQIVEKTGWSFSVERKAELRATYAGKSKGDLKLMGLQMERYDPNAKRGARALGLLLGGFLLTGLLGKRS